MKKPVKILVSVLLVVVILASIGWYLFEYDPGFARDILLNQAHRLEEKGRNNAAVWLYNLAYNQANRDDSVAVELAEYYKSIGNYSKAEYTLTKAIEDGGSVQLYIALCKTFVEQDKLRDAVAMMDRVTDPDIKAQLDTLRPATPVASHSSGHYSQYLRLHFEVENADVYAVFNGDFPSLASDLIQEDVVLSGGETTVLAVAVNEMGLVSSLAEYNYQISYVVEEAVFVDSAFESAIRDALGLTNQESILSVDLWNITEFRVPSAAVTCEDLHWLPNLQVLTLQDCAFDDLKLLQNLKKLHTVTVTDSVLSTKDLLVIAQLPMLENLTLSGCYLSTISNLASATNLTYLDLSNNSIRDLSGLSGLTRLEYLDLSSNALIDLEAITGLTQLQTLDVSYNSLITTAPVAALTNLTKLDVSANGLFKLEGIDALVDLTWFAASNNHLIDVDILAPCTKLQTLIISNNTILDLNVLQNHVDLEFLDFSYNEVSSLPKFNKNCQMQIINGGYNKLSSLDNLSVLQKLEYVYMDYNKAIKKIDKLTACTSLKVVNVYGSGVRNVSKLTALGIIVNFTPT